MDVLLQLFDVLMVKCIWLNYRLGTDEPTNSQRYLQTLEATFEVKIVSVYIMGLYVFDYLCFFFSECATNAYINCLYRKGNNGKITNYLLVVVDVFSVIDC